MPGPVRRLLASRGLAVALGAVGRFMITAGVVMLLLVAYQLWGTNLQTNRAQDQLRDQFEARLGRIDDGATVTSTTSSTTASTRPSDTTAPDSTPGTTPAKVVGDVGPITEGTPLGRISIPSIGLTDFYFLQGTTVAQLKRGAGHYEESPLPGQKGNAAIAGHRTTYGAPFHNIDKLANGDLIVVETFQGTFRYKMTEQHIVGPSDVSVLDDKGDNRLTLTACHPKFSARQRIIVFAELVGNPAPKLPDQDVPKSGRPTSAGPATATAPSTTTRASIDDYTREPIARFPGAWWGLACVSLWLLVRLLAWQGRRSRRYARAVPYLIGTPVCLLFLYFFFGSFSYEAFAHAVGLSV